MEPDHPAYEQMRLAIEALCTKPEPIRARLVAAAHHFAPIRPSDLRNDAEWNLYHRIGSGLVEGGKESDDDAITESLAALDDGRVAEIVTDIWHFFELVAAIDRVDAPWRWPRN
jgi:hypothetical protein